MKKLLFSIFFIFCLSISYKNAKSANWCKVIYNQNMTDGQLHAQLSKCKNSDNVFFAIHTKFQNAGHLLNSLVAEYCDIRRNIVSTNPRNGDPYFTAVCEFRRHILR